MLFVVRHGLKGDRGTQEDKANVEIEGDSHLTARGCQQAFLTGKMLKEKMKQLK